MRISKELLKPGIRVEYHPQHSGYQKTTGVIKQVITEEYIVAQSHIQADESDPWFLIENDHTHKSSPHNHASIVKVIEATQTNVLKDNRKLLKFHNTQGKYMYQNEIQQMMFVFGEVSEPLEETTQLIEEIVRSQLIEIIIQAVNLAQNKRAARILAPEDLIFLMRHDRAKVNRMRTFLSWKDVRKNVKDDKGATAPDEDLLEDVGNDDKQKLKKLKIKLPWEIIQSYANILSDDEEDDEIDEEEREASQNQIQRLKMADEITKNMTKEQYMYYSECRQASFTFKKAKRFKEFCQVAQYTEFKVNSDVLDILGFLAYDIVCKLTENGLAVKREFQRIKLEENRPISASDLEDGHFYLFDKPNVENSALLPYHIQEGYRRMQRLSGPMDNFRGGLVRTRVSLI